MKFFSWESTTFVLDSLFPSSVTWLCQFRLVSSVMPRNLKLATFSIFWPWITSGGRNCAALLFWGQLKVMYLVFFAFNDSLLTANQSHTFSSSMWISAAVSLVLSCWGVRQYVMGVMSVVWLRIECCGSCWRWQYHSGLIPGGPQLRYFPCLSWSLTSPHIVFYLLNNFWTILVPC